MSKRNKSIIAIVLVVAVIAGAGYAYYYINNKKATSADVNEDKMINVPVTRQRITKSLSGSGNITLTSLISVTADRDGVISKIHVSNGDYVEEGDLLAIISEDESTTDKYGLDKVRLELESAETKLNSLINSRDNYGIYAKEDGQITDIDISIGDSVTPNTNAITVKNTKKLKVVATFINVDNINIGDTADITVIKNFYNTKGIVTDISSFPVTVSGSGIAYEVTIEIDNPGSLEDDEIVNANIKNSTGTYLAHSAKVESFKEKEHSFNASGNVEEIHVSVGDTVKEGQLLATLNNEDLEVEISSQRIVVGEKQKKLEDALASIKGVPVYAPAAGTVLAKHTSEKSSINGPVGNNKGSKLFTLGNPDNFKMTIKVDELDILSVKKGMKANITIDALPGQFFEALVTEIDMIGSITNGIADYNVELLLTGDTSKLLNGMSATYDLVIADSENALTLPIKAITGKGEERWVMVENEGGGFKAQPIKVGIVNEFKAEIVEGLEEGTMVFYKESSIGNNEKNAMSGGGSSKTTMMARPASSGKSTNKKKR